MKLLSIRNEPHFLVRFEWAELKLLQKSSDAHYDGKCRSLNQCGGMIYGMTVEAGLSKGEPIERELSWQELDLLRKVLEVGALIPGKLEAASKLSHDLLQLMRDSTPKEAVWR